MTSTVRPVRRLAVTLALTGATAFGAVVIAPAALADESVPVTEAPVVEVPVVVAPPAVVIGKDGRPVKAPKVCTAKDLESIVTKVAQASQQALPLTTTADKLQASAVQFRAQALTAAVHQARQLTALAGAADWAAALLDQQAAKLIAKAGEKTCFEPQVPGGRF